MRQDSLIREFLKESLTNLNFFKLTISRKLNFIVINIGTTKACISMINESRLSSLRNEISSKLRSSFGNQNIELKINIIEIANINIKAEVLGEFAKQQIEKRVPFRRVIKTILLKAKRENINGIKIQISGRLNGAEIARTEWLREGRVPLHTLAANIDYSICKALLLLI